MRLVFDRGTVVAVDPPAGLDLTEAAGLRWDARVDAYRAPASLYGSIKARLACRCVPFRDVVRSNGPPPGSWSAIDLRPYQDAALWAWELSGRRGLVVLPTGSGKTRLALAAMARTGLATLCLVPTRVLLYQWLQAIRAVYPHAIGCFGDGERELAAITVATFESGYRHMERLGNRFDLLVVDEAHHFGTGIRDEALEMSIADARLGLSATPPRGDPALRLATLIGPTVYELGIGDLAGGFLADFTLMALHLELTGDERATYEALMATFRAVSQAFYQRMPTASWEDFVRSVAGTPAGRRALTAWRQARRLLALTEAKRETLRALLHRHRAARTLVFTADNATAYTPGVPHHADHLRHRAEGARRGSREISSRDVACAGIRAGAERRARRARCGRGDRRRGLARRARTRPARRASAPSGTGQAGARLRARHARDERGAAGATQAGGSWFPGRISPIACTASWDVIREPEPVKAGTTLLFPDFALQHRIQPERRWLLEIVGGERAPLSAQDRRPRGPAADRGLPNLRTARAGNVPDLTATREHGRTSWRSASSLSRGSRARKATSGRRPLRLRTGARFPPPPLFIFAASSSRATGDRDPADLATPL